MADILLTGVYDAAMRAFVTHGQGSDRFESDFLDAANYAISQINTEGNPETAVVRVDTTGDTVTNLDDEYTHVLTAGIWTWLLLSGNKPARGFERQVNHMANRFEFFISMMQTNIRNIAQDADTDDSTTSTMGLGPLG